MLDVEFDTWLVHSAARWLAGYTFLRPDVFCDLFPAQPELLFLLAAVSHFYKFFE